MRFKIVLTVLLSLGLLAFWSQPAQINISLNTGGGKPVVVVSPNRVTINPGDKVRWVSSGDSRARVEIDFAAASGKRGPFPGGGSSENPQRGRYNKRVGAPILTQGAADRGQWKYTVTWVAANGTRYVLDPMLVVK